VTLGDCEISCYYGNYSRWCEGSVTLIWRIHCRWCEASTLVDVKDPRPLAWCIRFRWCEGSALFVVKDPCLWIWRISFCWCELSTLFDVKDPHSSWSIRFSWCVGSALVHVKDPRLLVHIWIRIQMAVVRMLTFLLFLSADNAYRQNLIPLEVSASSTSRRCTSGQIIVEVSNIRHIYVSSYTSNKLFLLIIKLIFSNKNTSRLEPSHWVQILNA
jgi:hypothetical protein